MTASDVINSFRHAKAKRAEFLARRGWVRSTDFPDNRARWVKTFKGRELPLSAAGAFALERGMQ